MAVFETVKLLNLISRKISVVPKAFNFHTVLGRGAAKRTLWAENNYNDGFHSLKNLKNDVEIQTIRFGKSVDY